jgi:hypothetical protein
VPRLRQEAEHAAKVTQQAPALLALAHVMLQACTRALSQITVDVRGHAPGCPAVIAPYSSLMQKDHCDVTRLPSRAVQLRACDASPWPAPRSSHTAAARRTSRAGGSPREPRASRCPRPRASRERDPRSAGCAWVSVPIDSPNRSRVRTSWSTSVSAESGWKSSAKMRTIASCKPSSVPQRAGWTMSSASPRVGAATRPLESSTRVPLRAVPSIHRARFGRVDLGLPSPVRQLRPMPPSPASRVDERSARCRPQEGPIAANRHVRREKLTRCVGSCA